MASKVSKILVGIILTGSLVACQQKPMIELSEENKAKIEAKQMQEKSERQAKKESEKSNAQRDESYDSSAGLPLDKEQWVLEKDGVEYPLEAFLPFHSNQVKEFSNQQVSYVDFYDETNRRLQVSHFTDQKQICDLYRWNAETIEHYGHISQAQLFFNYLEQPENKNELSQSITWLKAPLIVGASWTDENQEQVTITHLYKTIQLQGQNYSQVIEKEISSSQGIRHQLIAAGKGLLAEWIVSDSDENQMSYLQNQTDNVMIVRQIPWYLPDETNPQSLVKKETIDLAWQTNDGLTSVLDRFYHEKEWIGSQIQLLDAYEKDGIAHLNFTSGVVATLNQHPAGEKAVVTAMMANIANYFQVEKVRLEVFGNGMLTNTIAYPENGVHTVESQWLDWMHSDQGLSSDQIEPHPMTSNFESQTSEEITIEELSN